MVSVSVSSSPLMIRTKENALTGPFPREEVIRRVLNGQLRESDEICAGDGYWIYLHERGECRSLLGVELPRRKDFHEERTEPGTETETATATKPLDSGGLKSEFEAHLGSTGGTLSTRPKGQTETVGTFKLVLWGVLILVGFILFQIFRISDGL